MPGTKGRSGGARNGAGRPKQTVKLAVGDLLEVDGLRLEIIAVNDNDWLQVLDQFGRLKIVVVERKSPA